MRTPLAVKSQPQQRIKVREETNPRFLSLKKKANCGIQTAIKCDRNIGLL